MLNDINDKQFTQENSDINISKRNELKQKDKFKTKRCKVLNYNKKSKTAYVSFDGFGVTLRNIESIENEIEVRYKGTIGKSDFQII